MEAVQIHSAPGSHDIVVLTTDWAGKNCAFESSSSERLTAARASIVVCVQGFFEAAEENVVAADFFRAQSSGRNCIETKNIFPADFTALRFRFAAIAAELRERHERDGGRLFLD